MLFCLSSVAKTGSIVPRTLLSKRSTADYCPIIVTATSPMICQGFVTDLSITSDFIQAIIDSFRKESASSADNWMLKNKSENISVSIFRCFLDFSHNFYADIKSSPFLSSFPLLTPPFTSLFPLIHPICLSNHPHSPPHMYLFPDFPTSPQVPLKYVQIPNFQWQSFSISLAS